MSLQSPVIALHLFRGGTESTLSSLFIECSPEKIITRKHVARQEPAVACEICERSEIQRTPGLFQGRSRNAMGVDHRSPDVAMSQQRLNYKEIKIVPEPLPLIHMAGNRHRLFFRTSSN